VLEEHNKKGRTRDISIDKRNNGKNKNKYRLDIK
jgi:hypothetical protein